MIVLCNSEGLYYVPQRVFIIILCNSDGLYYVTQRDYIM